MNQTGETVTDERMLAAVQRAADLIANAEALLITAGAGMGVDSGLPDFRSARGFWRAYPPLEKLALSFEEMAQPRWFAEKPKMAWAWYGHRLQLYRDTKPHAGHTFRTSRRAFRRNFRGGGGRGYGAGALSSIRCWV